MTEGINLTLLWRKSVLIPTSNSFSTLQNTARDVVHYTSQSHLTRHFWRCQVQSSASLHRNMLPSSNQFLWDERKSRVAQAWCNRDVCFRIQDTPSWVPGIIFTIIITQSQPSFSDPCRPEFPWLCLLADLGQEGPALLPVGLWTVLGSQAHLTRCSENLAFISGQSFCASYFSGHFYTPGLW